MIPEPTSATDPDSLLAALLKRICVLRTELGEPAYERSLKTLLAALGTAALAEAERRARALAERTDPRPTDIRVTAHARRVGDPDGFDIAD